MSIRNIQTIVFLILKLIPVSILLGICRIQNGFNYRVSGDRRDRFYLPHFMIEAMESLGIQGTGSNCPNSDSWMVGCLRCPCLHDSSPGVWGCCSFGSHGLWMLCPWKVWAGHSEWKLWRFHGHSHEYMQRSINPPLGGPLQRVWASESAGACIDMESDFQSVGSLSHEISDTLLLLVLY